MMRAKEKTGTRLELTDLGMSWRLGGAEMDGSRVVRDVLGDRVGQALREKRKEEVRSREKVNGGRVRLTPDGL